MIGFPLGRKRAWLRAVREMLVAMVWFGMGISVVLNAGVSESEAPIPEETKTKNGGDWCFLIPEKPGKLIDNPDAKWVQYLQFGIYAHNNSAAVDGRAGGKSFWYTHGGEWRRVRATVKAKVFDSINLAGQVNLVHDEGRIGGGIETDYFGIFSAWAELDLNKLWKPAGLDGWSIAYGKRKLVELNEEVDTSINAILTVERSAFASLIAPFRAATGTTGVWMKAKRGKDSFSLGVFTTDSSREFGDWQDGNMLISSWKHDFSECWNVDTAILSLGGGWNNSDGRDERYALWDWLFTPWLRVDNNRWGLRVSGALGNNEGPGYRTGGAFYGLTVMPTWWLLEDRLQAVFRYEVMGSEAPRGVRLNFRYAREAGGPTNESIPSLAAGFGDFHQSFYGGLVWIVCPKRMTLLCGLEWEQLKSRDLSVYNGTTGWFAARVMF